MSIDTVKKQESINEGINGNVTNNTVLWTHTVCEPGIAFSAISITIN